MLISTGRKPIVSSYRIPTMGEVAYQVEDSATLVEPLGNSQSLDVWVVRWHENGRHVPSDFMLFTRQPEVQQRRVQYRLHNEMPFRQKADEHYRRTNGVPDDAAQTDVPSIFGHYVDRTLEWYEVMVP